MVVYIVSQFCGIMKRNEGLYRLVYNVLTGNVERRLSIRNNNYGVRRETCVRDVSWHPLENYIVSTSVLFFQKLFLFIDLFLLVG